MKKALVFVYMLCFSSLYAQSQTIKEKDPPPPSSPEYPLLKTPPPPFHPLFKKKHAV